MGRCRWTRDRAQGIGPWIPVGLMVFVGGLAGCSTGSKPAGLNTTNNETSNNTLAADDHTTFHVEGPVGGPFPNAQRPIVLTNRGAHPARWQADATLPWLDFSKSQGTLDSGESERVVVSIDQTFAATLNAGEYLADIIFRNQDASNERIAIEFVLTVYESTSAGVLLVTPEEDFETSAEIGGEIEQDSKEYRLSNIGGDTMRYAISSSAPWVTLSGDSFGSLEAGSTHTISVGFDSTLFGSLGAGEHEASVEFANATNGAGTSTREVHLTLGGGGGRVSDGLIAYYGFDEGGGNVVRDIANSGPALDLVIPDSSSVTWLPGGLSLHSDAAVHSLVAASKISQACSASNEVTVEAWVRPANVTQEGPARIVSLSGGLFERNFSLSQGQYGELPAEVFDVRVRTTQTDDNGIPSQTTPTGSATTELTHVLFTRQASGVEKIYVDGELVRQASVAGNFSNWNLGYSLWIGNEVTENRPWLGIIHLAAIYDRALSAEEVVQNFDSGTQDPGVGHLTVSPAGDYFITGTEGQDDFAPLSKTYTVSNTGTDVLQWSANLSDDWVSFSSATSGTLQAGASAEVRITLDESQAQQRAPGSYYAVAQFVNVTTGYGTTARNIKLTVNSAGGGGDPDKPGPHNTGPYDESILVPSNGLNITQNGAVYENLDITGSVTISANNVTLRNFRINGQGAHYGIKMTDNNFGIVLEDGEITHVDSAGLYGGGFTARRLEIHEMGTDAIKTTRDTVIEYCWAHHLGMNVGAHADCNQTRQGSNFIFRFNNFDIPASVEPPYNSNATLIIQTAEGPIDNVLIENNWLQGGNFTVYIENKAGYGHGDPTNARLIGNRFGRDYRYGVLDTTGYVYCSGNVWDDTGELMDINND